MRDTVKGMGGDVQTSNEGKCLANITNVAWEEEIASMDLGIRHDDGLCEILLPTNHLIL
jgi:hypothetical protein